MNDINKVAQMFQKELTDSYELEDTFVDYIMLLFTKHAIVVRDTTRDATRNSICTHARAHAWARSQDPAWIQAWAYVRNPVRKPEREPDPDPEPERATEPEVDGTRDDHFCHICYDEVKHAYQLASFGCCTAKLCRSCLSRLPGNRCPVCCLPFIRKITRSKAI